MNSKIVLSQEEAEFVKHLEKAACEYGAVMDVLTAIESLQQNGKPNPSDERLLEIASLAAGLARVARKEEN